MNTICGIDCNECMFYGECSGCISTQGKPFGYICPVARCCFSQKHESCDECKTICHLQNDLIKEFNALGIDDMAEISELHALKGSYVNLEYTLPNGQKTKLLNENKLYLGNQISKKESNRCYGLVADDDFLLVCEYGADASNPEIIVYKKR